MFPFTKLAIFTCLFYVGFSLLLDGAILGLASWISMAGIHFQRGGRFLFFGLIWLVSFSVAWRIVMTPLFSRNLK